MRFFVFGDFSKVFIRPTLSLFDLIILMLFANNNEVLGSAD